MRRETKIIFKSAFKYKAYSKKGKSVKQNVPVALPSILSNMLTEFIIKNNPKIEKIHLEKRTNMGITKPCPNQN